MTDMEYDVVYVARSPASMKQDEFAAMVDEMCNGRAAGGWRLVARGLSSVDMSRLRTVV